MSDEIIKRNIPELEQFKQRFTILIADDNENNCYMLRQRLLREGYSNIEIAHDGIEALAIIHAKKIDLVMLDIMMPGLDGFGVLRELQNDILNNRIMVLVISSADETSYAIDCINLGAEDFLPKPFNLNLLRVRVRTCLEKKWYQNKQEEYKNVLEKEMHTYQDLLHVILPAQIVKELTQTNIVKPRVYHNVAVIFADVANFTAYCRMHTPEEIFESLQSYISLCEELAKKHKLEKIKSIGDAFMATSGLFIEDKTPVSNAILFALDLFVETKKTLAQWSVHIGIDIGSVIGGIVGKDKYLFEIWGDTVNTAARLQELAKPDSIYLSAEAWHTTHNQFDAKSLGLLDVKGKGQMEVFEIKHFDEDT